MKRLSVMAILIMGVVHCSREVQVDGRSVPEWIGLFRHEDWNTRLRSQEVLSRLGPPALPYLRRALRSEDPAVRLGVVSTLRKMGARGKEAVDDLLAQLAREHTDSIRAEILRALLAIDPQQEKVQEAFRKRLADQSEQVRAAAQAALEFSKPAEAIQLDSSSETQAQYQLREHLQKILPEGPVALLAEVQRENLRVAIYWPIMSEGKLGSKTFGQLFKRQDGSWVPEGNSFELSTPQGHEILSQKLQGSDKQRLFRPCGVKKEDFAMHLAGASEKFFSALEKKDHRLVGEAAEQLAQALDFRSLVFQSLLPQLLEKRVFGPPSWKVEFQAEGDAIAEVQSARYRLKLSPCASGIVLNSIEHLGTDEKGASK